MNAAEIILLLKQNSDAKYLQGMKRFGMDNSKALGVPLPQLRKIAKSVNKDHQLALDLWETGIHECRLMASLADDPKLVIPQQMDKWVADFYSWDVCDQVCGNLFDRTEFAIDKALEWSNSENEYIKRAGFVLMAEFAVHNKKAGNEQYVQFFPIIEREAWDDRNFVKKAVNWALRQIGKRNRDLHKIAIACANRIAQQESKAAKRIAKDALNEFDKKFKD
jgi:3-methyladenine DNA glycosylase AlkD